MENTNQNKHENCNHEAIDMYVVCETCVSRRATVTFSLRTLSPQVDDPNLLDSETSVNKRIQQGTIYNYVKTMGRLPLCEKCNKPMKFAYMQDNALGGQNVIVLNSWPDKIESIAQHEFKKLAPFPPNHPEIMDLWRHLKFESYKGVWN